MAPPTPIPAFAPVLKPLDAVPVCEGDPDDVVADADDIDVVVAEEVEEGIEVTAVLLTEKVVDKAVGAGSEKISVVGSLQSTVIPSDSVPQQDQSLVTLLYMMSAR